MTKLSSHHSSKFVKLIYCGDSGTGKSGSLVSLVKAGYNLRILDMDNGLDALKEQINLQCPDKIDQVDYITLRDPVKGTSSGPLVTAKAYVEAIKCMNEWDDGSIPAEGGENEVFVVDSTTTLGRAAYSWAKAQQPGAKDPRQWYFAAQQSFENVVAMLTDEAFHANVILIAHVTYRELQDGTTKGYPSAVGSALGPTIPRYFNTLIEAQTTTSGLGSDKKVQRTIRTVPTTVLDLKNPAPFRIDAEYDLNEGLSSIFAKLKGTTNA